MVALRHPLRSAKEFATLDVLSGGRVICGVGAGHVAEEFDLMGPDFDQRGQATDEAIAGLATGLVDEFPVLDGPRWEASGVGLEPRPVQSPRPPIWVGRVVAGRAAPRRPLRRRLAPPVTRAQRGAAGHAAPAARRVPRRCAPRHRGHRRLPLRRHAPAGLELPRGRCPVRPEELAEYLRTFADAGVGQVQVRFPSRTAGELCDQIAAFADEVVPLVDR